MRGASLSGQSKYEEAEPLLLSGYEGMQHQATIPPESRDYLQSGGVWIGPALPELGKTEEGG